MQKALLMDVKKRNNREVVKLKMEKTFAHRRHEVVRDAPMVEDFMARWPALFDVSEVSLISHYFFSNLEHSLKKKSIWYTGRLPICVVVYYLSLSSIYVMVNYSLQFTD